MTEHSEPIDTPVAEAGTVRDAAPSRSRAMPTWQIATISGIFGLFYAYALWNAVAFLIDFAAVLSGSGWGLLLFAVVFPVIVFGAAFVLGYRRHWWDLALLHLAGLGLVAVFWLNVLAYSAPAGQNLVS